MTSPIHVVSVGARTPLGLTAAASAAALRAGINRVTEIPFLLDREGAPLRGAHDKHLPPLGGRHQRLVELVSTAIEEMGSTIPEAVRARKIPLFIALPELRPGWTEEDRQALIRGLQARSGFASFQPIETFPVGHAAGLLALDMACRRIESREAEIAIICGVDSYLDCSTLRWLHDSRQLATTYHRGAFFPGEGAGAFAVAPEPVMRRHGIESLALIRGIGVATEDRLIKTDSVCLGTGLSESVRKAVSQLKLPEEAIDGVIGDINGERYRSEEWGFTILRMSEAFVNPTGNEIPASCWGEMGAASGPLAVVLAVIAGLRGWAKGPRYLVWNSSEGGQRAALVLELRQSRPGRQR